MAWSWRHNPKLGTLNKGQQMNTLHLLIACDLGFALFVWWVYRDHNRKMDALYKKYDKEYADRDRRIDGTDKNWPLKQQKKLDNSTQTHYIINITTKHGDNMKKKRTSIYDRVKITFSNGTILQIPRPTDLSEKDLTKQLAQLEQNKLVLSATIV